MPLLAQWVRQRPWLAAGIASAAGGVAGLAGGIAAAASAVGGMAIGSISTKTSALEHPEPATNDAAVFNQVTHDD